MSSPPELSPSQRAAQTRQRLKRPRSPSPSTGRGQAAGTSGRSTAQRATNIRGAARSSSPDGRNTSLPPSSPQRFSDTDDNSGISDVEAVPDVDEVEGRPVDEDDEGEDLFGEDMEEDYVRDPRLDRYDKRDINDEEEFDEMDPAARRAAEQAMDRRDRAAGRGPGRRAAARERMPFILSDGMEADDDDDLDPAAGLLAGMKPRVRKQYDERKDIDDAEGIEDTIPLEHLSDIKANSIAEWIATPSVQRSIEQHFRHFLLSYRDEAGSSVYGERIKDLGETNAESLEVNYHHLANSKAVLAYFLSNSPSSMLAIFDNVALACILLFYPSYERIHSEIHVRITHLPTFSTLRSLRRNDLNSLVRVSGVITRRTGVFPQLKYVKFDCRKCGAVLGPFYQDALVAGGGGKGGGKEVKIGVCPQCSGRGPFTVNSEMTVYRNYQRMTLQEAPGSVPPGRLPRHREVILLWDLIDSAKPGEEVEVTGIYRNNFDASLNTKNGFPVFSTIIEANYISRNSNPSLALTLSEADEKEIRQLGRDPRIAKRIFKSIAPSIYGHEDIKTAIALSLFGGVKKNIKDKHRIRGDINVLMLGDPGTAKSQFLKYVEKTAPRAVFTTGQGASAVGLTASVRKDPVTREWTLEGGALVLADKGVCLIDEFDKMNESDRTSIHEAMEQQTISVSKAGIITTLQARCAVIAAANPIKGRYDGTVGFGQNVALTEPILSRFDVLCVVRDLVDPVVDELLARFVIGSHLRSHPKFEGEVEEMTIGDSLDQDIIPQDLLRKYILYARERVEPKLHDIDRSKMSNLFADLRRESLATGSFPITVRHLESMIRMAEASAKMHLREYVRADDVDLAISVAVQSFLSAQKLSVRRSLERGFRKYLSHARDHEELLAFLLGQMIKDKVRQHQLVTGSAPDRVVVTTEALEARAKDHEIYEAAAFYRSKLFSTNGYKINAAGEIEKVFRSDAGL
ncbi:DNA replication licensing factor mcm2; AltName: Full=Cell division control protein 19; AltName: Full=Minichromosome maintenance protein 2 [Serendipita indica DSM 11827]|nr:DNA replication licensing factor mcm2; AltName: Full=Cell division control protein 19; AltName: Full=Minichromosome maintenance protein 2 [Serendipita indica DSM 11827]